MARKHPYNLWLQLRLVKAYRNVGDLEAAFAVLRTVVESNPNEVWLQAKMSKTLNNLKAKHRLDSILEGMDIDENIRSEIMEVAGLRQPKLPGI